MYHMYASHPVAMNPFRSAFAEVFIRERDAAAARLSGKVDEELKAGVVDKHEVEKGGPALENWEGHEQLVWVLWKILKGDGIDVRCASRCSCISIYSLILRYPSLDPTRQPHLLLLHSRQS